jgi:hypothetical protein
MYEAPAPRIYNVPRLLIMAKVILAYNGERDGISRAVNLLAEQPLDLVGNSFQFLLGTFTHFLDTRT